MSDQQQPDLGMQVLDEALGVPDQAREREPDDFTPPPTQPTRTGGYQPLIEAKRKELIALEKKIEEQDKTGAYLDTDQNGNQYLNYVRMQQDQMRITKLAREIGELREQQRQMETEREQRKHTATDIARTVAKREVQLLPEELRRPTLEVFAAMVKQITSDGEWGKSLYSDRSKIEGALVQVFNTAIGEAIRKQRQTGGNPAASGLDGQYDEKPSEKPENDEDDFTNNLMYAYQRRQKGHMTVAQLRAAERAKAEAAKTGGKA